MICVYGSLDQVKDASLGRKRSIGLFRRVPALCWTRADCVPLLGDPEDIRCYRCDRRQGRSPCLRDGPAKLSIPTEPREGRRHPEERDAFHRRDNRVWLRKDHSFRPHASASRSRRPHFFPKLGRVFDWALQASRCGHPRSVTFVTSRDEHLFNPLDEENHAWELTTQACQLARPVWPSTDAD
jgi:hypothetical protein